MKQNLLLFLMASAIVICTIVAVFILSLSIWALLGIGFLGAVLLAVIFAGGSAYALYKKILKEIQQFNIDLDLEEDEF